MEKVINKNHEKFTEDGTRYYEYKGRIINIDKHPIQDNSVVTGIDRKHQSYYECSRRYAGGNGTYIEFGEYRGMALDVTYSLYDTNKNFVEIKGGLYIIPRHIKIDIYKEVLDAYGLQRLSPQKYNDILSLEGKKSAILLIFNEESASFDGECTNIKVGIYTGITINGKNIYKIRNLSLNSISSMVLNRI